MLTNYQGVISLLRRCGSTGPFYRIVHTCDTCNAQPKEVASVGIAHVIVIASHLIHPIMLSRTFYRTKFYTCRRRSILPPCLTINRRFHIEGLALAPFVYTGLFIGLWTWKCIMMIVFQDKIIYNPFLPPNSRWEKIEDYKTLGIRWREERIKSLDGVEVALCVGGIDVDVGGNGGEGEGRDVYVLYFQGNASSTPPRLPDLSKTLTILRRQLELENETAAIRATTLRSRCTVTIVCLSYRGYWTSRGRPSERGIRLDALAAFQWIESHHHHTHTHSHNPNPNKEIKVILWGQSIGSGIATNLAADLAHTPTHTPIDSLVLETPFTSTRDMLVALYPQKWLPYRYLWPFLRNRLDSFGNLDVVASPSPSQSQRVREREREKEKKKPEIFILQAAKDELVPAELTQQLYDKCVELDIPVSKAMVSGAFHNDALFREEGKRAVAGFLKGRVLS
ncbi:Alpha/Beta hydrolase protein [Poronia punctata]|nr:Alpha/Beta hydrolase protein [Poronia punctata]